MPVALKPAIEGDVDDRGQVLRGASPPASAVLEPLRRGDDIAVEDLADHVGVGVEHRPEVRVDPGVVDEMVEPAEGCSRRGDDLRCYAGSAALPAMPSAAAARRARPRPGERLGLAGGDDPGAVGDKTRAIPRPIPREAPVTMATAPS